MEDQTIIDLYFQRQDQAIRETEKKYKKYLFTISFNILKNREDVEEILNQVYLKVWQRIPPEMPRSMQAFLSKITRDLSIDRYRSFMTKKRGQSQYDLALDELEDILSNSTDPLDEVLKDELVRDIEDFLSLQPEKSRQVFLARYFYFDSIKEISQKLDLTQANTKTLLSRTRQRLKVYLIERGYDL